PPVRGPWEQVWAEGGTVHHETLDGLPWTLRELAREAGFRAMSCFPVKPRHGGRAEACLVVWRREDGPMRAYAVEAALRASAIATLAIARGDARDDDAEESLRDPLTGLGNRDGFFRALDARVRSGTCPAVLYIGLDDFSAVNERLGLLAGDAVLRVTARRLVSITRPSDELARLGGDEFAVLCDGSISEHQIVRIAARVVGQLSKPLSVGDGETLDVGASIGIALNLPPGTPAEAVLGRADHALLEAKAKGKRQWALAEAS
ncbi:MAG: GGDEF domain-containing protein, partial [Acidimicrobiales bacterium]